MSMLDRIRDGFKYLDKNGLKHLIEKIKLHDVHWTGTHAEYEAVKDTIPAYAILHFTDDYDENVQVGIYSTEETKTGELWIDNKPIYRKVLTGNMPNVAGTAPAYTCIATLTTYGALNIDTVVEVTGGIYYGKTAASTPINQLGFLPMGRIHVVNGSTTANCNDETFWYTSAATTPANRALILYTSGSQVSGLYNYNPPYIAVVRYTKTTD